MNFEHLIAKVKTCGKQTLAVAAAEDDAVLEAVDASVTRQPSARSRPS